MTSPGGAIVPLGAERKEYAQKPLENSVDPFCRLSCRICALYVQGDLI